MSDFDDLTLEELAELRYEEFLLHEDWIMLNLQWEELKLSIGEAILDSWWGRFVYWLITKFKRFEWLKETRP